MLIYKGYQIKADPQSPGCLRVVTDGLGGKIPDCLSGRYTNYTFAIRDVDNYVEVKASRGRNAKTETEK